MYVHVYRDIPKGTCGTLKEESNLFRRNEKAGLLFRYSRKHLGDYVAIFVLTVTACTGAPYEIAQKNCAISYGRDVKGLQKIF